MKRIVGYTDPLSVEPGAAIRAFISCEAPISSYEAQVVRMLAGDSWNRGASIRFKPIQSPLDGPHRANHQDLHPGSFAVMPEAEVRVTSVLTIGVTLKPTLTVTGNQALVCWGNPWHGGGVTVLVDGDRRPMVAVSTGAGVEQFAGDHAAELDRWYRLVVSVSVAGEVEIRLSDFAHPSSDYVNIGRLQAHVEFPPEAQIVVAAAPLGSRVSQPRDVRWHFNGVLERPWISVDKHLTPEHRDMLSSPASATIPDQIRDSILALWDFAQKIDTWDVVDIGARQLHGQLLNLPRRGVCGSNWDGSVKRWLEAPAQYGAIHFLRDSVGDCSWEPSLEFSVPLSFRSGFYAFRIVADGEEEFLPFFVRPISGYSTAPILVVAPSATYLSYGNSRFWWEDPIQEAVQDRLLEIGPEDEWVINHPDVGPSSYDRYDDGTDVCYVSRLRPNLMMRPGHCRHEGYVMDLYLVEWLDRLGYAYDVVTDEDLDASGLDLIVPYQVVITGTHPEYISAQEWDALKAFRDSGGRIMYLGGNGFHARIAFDPSRPWIMENRRVDFWLDTRHVAEGERYFSLDGESGGLLEHVSRPPMDLVGVTSVTMGFDESRPFHRSLGQQDPRAAFVFAGIDDETIGDFGLVLGGAVGQEWDNAYGYMGPPAHIVLASSEGHSLVPPLFGATRQPYHADMVLLLPEGGGAVFSASSMAWCGSLSHNGYANNVSVLTRNVLDRFLDPEPFDGGKGE